VYATVCGTSPLEIRIENDDIEDAKARFDVYDESDRNLILRMSVRPTPGTVAYQVPLNFYWYSHFWEKGPEIVHVMPDA
jgi:hypothetical protein